MVYQSLSVRIECKLVADVSAKGDRQMNWNIGDIAICITPGSNIDGLEVEITSGLHSAPSSEPHTNGVAMYTIDPGFPPPPPFTHYASTPQNLIPLPPANEVTTWEECIFKPRELVT